MSKPTLTLPIGENLGTALAILRDAYPRRAVLPEGQPRPEPDTPEAAPTDEALVTLAVHALSAVVSAHPEAVCREVRCAPGFPAGTHPGVRVGVQIARFVAKGLQFQTLVNQQAAALRAQQRSAGLVAPDGRPAEVAAQSSGIVVPVAGNGRKPS